jgi:hypothetical protein
MKKRNDWGDKIPNKSLGGHYIIFYIAQAYYFTDNYEQAYEWYNRFYKCHPNTFKCLDDYFEEVKRILGKTE